MDVLNIQIVESIQTIDVVCMANKKYRTVKNVSYSIPVPKWSMIEVIFNGVSSFARPPSVLNKIMLTVNEPLPV